MHGKAGYESLFDDPRYTVDALVELQEAIVRFNERYAVWKGMHLTTPPSTESLARDWDGLDLSSVVPVLREARHMVNLIAGYDEEADDAR